VDLGPIRCRWTNGAGLLRVTSGWVDFEHDGGGVHPQGDVRHAPGRGPAHRATDALRLRGSLNTLDFGGPGDPGRAAALDLILSHARRRDALTLWHLLSRGTWDERGRVYDRLNELAPAPRGVTRESVLRGDRGELAYWWDTLGVDTGSWWKLLKKKF
jgi:hypothetical protein